MRRSARAVLGLALIAAGLPACSSSCDKKNEEPEVWSGTTGVVSTDCTEYQTGTFGDEYVHFPPGHRWRFEHGLGTLPSEVKSYLAFVKNPLPSDANGNTAESAGNQVII